MLQYGLPVLYAMFVWWFGTGLILWLDRRPRHTHPWTLGGATIVLVVAVAALFVLRDDTSVAGAYHGFTAGVAIWAWHETAFLMGYVTGPRRRPLSADSGPWRRFSQALGAILWHELAILVTVLGLLALTWGADNQVGTWTFAVLWIMRLSAKLNVFLGVPNMNDEFLPERLRYLESYFRVRTMNALFPLSVTLGTLAALLIGQSAADPAAGAFEVAAAVFLTTLIGLAVLEHWFLVLPLPDAALWRWAMREDAGRQGSSPPTRGTAPGGLDDTRFETPAQATGST